MAQYALVDAGNITRNIIEWDGQSAYQPPAGLRAVLAASAAPFVAPSVPQVVPPTLQAQMDLATKLGAGLQVTSTGTPTINGTYPLDPLSLAHIAAVYAGIKGGDGLPGGGATFNHQDLSGAPHAFSAAQFAAFAKAARDYVYALTEAARVEASGGTPTWPAPAVAIP